MIVLMVSIWEVRMGMGLWLMGMSMGMFAAGLNRLVMGVLVVFVMNMLVFVLQPLVGVLVFVMLCQVKPDADGHQCPGE